MSNTMYLVTGVAGIIVTVSPDYNPVVMNVNVVGTKNIIRCCLTHPECKKLVYCSSTGAIPEVTQTVLDAVKLENLNACVVHPSGILGPEDFAVGETTKTVICLSDKNRISENTYIKIKWIDAGKPILAVGSNPTVLYV